MFNKKLDKGLLFVKVLLEQWAKSTILGIGCRAESKMGSKCLAPGPPRFPPAYYASPLTPCLHEVRPVRRSFVSSLIYMLISLIWSWGGLGRKSLRNKWLPYDKIPEESTNLHIPLTIVFHSRLLFTGSKAADTHLFNLSQNLMRSLRS